MNSQIILTNSSSISDPVLADRIHRVVSLFEESFKNPPSFVIRVPGRVNLIGEHIDYCGYPVFPMAIERDVLIAISNNDEKELRLVNSDTIKYPSFSCQVDKIEIERPPKWNDYFLCGIVGVLEELSNNNILDLKGMNAVLCGSIPPSAGLSSSSAIVCGAAVATRLLLTPDTPIEKVSLAASCAQFERLIGTAGGGMDQAIQFLAQENEAKVIHFFPSLDAISVPLPEGVNFFISHSGVECNKAATNFYNIRVLETRLAALLIGQKHNLPLQKCTTLSAVQRMLNISLEEAEVLAENILQQESYSVNDVLQILSLSSVKELFCTLGIADESRFATALKQQLKLRNRAMHVYSEASRVLQFEKVCEDTAMCNEEKIRKLGQLMNKSHASCRYLYECSAPELDCLVDSSLKCGAVGSRLTGAGWGGCTVSLVPAECVENYKKLMKQTFPEDSFTFCSRPSSGICVYSEFNN